MKTTLRVLFIATILQFLNTIVLSGQNASPKKIDSANTAILDQYKIKLSSFETQRLADSMRKAELEMQIQNLKTTENLKKEDLLQQLNDLNTKEAHILAQKRQKIDSMRSSAHGYPVVCFFQDTLFMIYSKVGSIDPSERAEVVSKRIQSLSGVLTFSADSIVIIPTENFTDIMMKDKIIMSISDDDALWENKTQGELAEKYKAIIVKAVMNYQKETSVSILVKEMGLALLVLIVLFVILYYTGKFYRWLSLKIWHQKSKLVSEIKIRGYVLFNENQLAKTIASGLTTLKWLTYVLLIYISLPILFGIFPWTQHFADTLFGYILNPVKRIVFSTWSYLPNFFTIAIIIIFFSYIIKGIKFLKVEIEYGKLEITGFYPEWANPTFHIIRILLYAFMFILIFPYLPGSNSPIFQGVSVFLGFLLTFGSAGSVSNIVSGIILTYMRLFKTGDRVKIGEVTGDVIESNMLVTRLRTIKNEIVSIPNSTVMSSHTINFSSDAPVRGLIIHTTVTLGYDIPWKQINEALVNAALKTDDILKEPAPFVLQTSLDDFYVSYQINAYTQQPNKQAEIYSRLHQNIQDCCNEAGIEIMSPHYRAMRDGNQTTIPENYLANGYQKPSFDITVQKKD